MVETKDYEIITIEKEKLNMGIIKEYVASEFVNVYMVILDNGRFIGFFNNAILLEEMRHDRFWREDCLVIDPMQNSKDFFCEARKYFSIIKNRNFPLPIISKEGQVLTFFEWNQHLEKPDNYLEDQKRKILELLERGYTLEFENWDEYTGEYVYGLFDAESSQIENMKFSGRNWEIHNMLKNHMVSIHPDNDNGIKNHIVINSSGIQYPVKEHEVIPLMDVTEGLRKYYNKKIYAWLKNYETSLLVGKMIFQHGYWVEGFCELNTHRKLTRLLGKEFVDLESIIEKEDVLILVEGKEDRDYLDNHFQKGKGILWDEMFNLRKDLVNREKFQTWGKREEIDFYKKTFGLKFACENSKQNRPESAVLMWEKAECLKTPQNYKKYIDNFNPDVKWYAWNFVYETLGKSYADIIKMKNMDIAIEENKKFAIYGIESHYTNHWMHLLECIGVSYQFMEDEEILDWYGYHVESIFELSYQDLDNVFIIINKPYEKLKKAIDILSDYNISFENNNAICIYDYIANLDRRKIFADVCAGPVPKMLLDEDFPCYYMIGEQEQDTYKIMTLGGSNTESTLFTYESWPEELGKMLKNAGIKATIYNGGIATYSSIQECTKLIRDIKYIKPDMVISFSGFNDGAGIKTTGRYIYGMEKRSVDNWLQNEKMMNLICEQYGAKFYCFVQPQIYHKDFEDKYWNLFTQGYREEMYPDWKEEIEKQKDCPWLVNLLDILDEHFDVYFDVCHVTTEGNKIIAKHIYDHIIDDIRGK